MMVYKFVSAEDTITKIALLGKRERNLLEKSKIAKQIKVYEVNIPERHWMKPRPIPAYNLKVIKQITFKIKIVSSTMSKKTKVHEKLYSLICNLPIEFNNRRLNIDLYQASGTMLCDLPKLCELLRRNRPDLIFNSVTLRGTGSSYGVSEHVIAMKYFMQASESLHLYKIDCAVWHMTPCFLETDKIHHLKYLTLNQSSLCEYKL